MALQTSHSAEPSSTPTSTSSNNDNDVQQHNPFSPAGSPPLILAFLSIGLFAAAMIVVFGWRRIQFGRNSWTLGTQPNGEGATGAMLLNKPQLWDLWNKEDTSWNQVAGKEKGGHGAELQWGNIMPLTATMVTEVTGENVKPLSPPSLRRDLLHPRLQLFRAWPERWRRPKHRERRKSFDESPPSTLQVGVAILMPSPQYPVYVKKPTNIEHDEQGRRRERKEITDYSIGMYECTWD
ncbi:hypothetical protein GALMADRAFT_242481 [Galerina marginata CBS 339.88]|uniref:Uncharacterized protein n=1 Tax=Galerina marginata (strain CBS 339.88) TaxID=685588 RepID=A0A067TMK4_GALM3|nr:hypothetical protein GALMADRAFT_242481 [Galerina marginata CBS 339.88]